MNISRHLLAAISLSCAETLIVFADDPPADPPKPVNSQTDRVENPPPMQMFLPGFTVRELPLDLANINNVKYRLDGTLVALGYDGKVWLLRDTNGDGLEDKADLFSDNASGLRSAIGMDLTPPGYAHGNGVLTVGKTRCLLILDTDGDDKADKEIEVADRWPESFHAVDGLGAAFDPSDHSIFYGRGTYNFVDPFLRDKEGKPHYSLTDESGAIIHVSPDFKSHEIVATGIRFPVSLRFNRHGDLFATDQEGATWVPNGNPFDELLHIQKGRHYGFPARHPTMLPDVIDEPSTFDYGPQHQSNCGMNFNEPVREGGATFGPAAWSGDALVAGYSRGKLYRTKLVKTAIGYVAQTQLLGCLNMLTVDACVAPDGGLVVACHSGGPDWGSGPTGKGKLFKIDYTDRDHPQPIFVWTSGPREIRVEFDRPVPAELLRHAVAQSKLTAGPFVRAGDRFESLWPGYKMVEVQKAAPRTPVAIHSAQLTPDGRTLVLATDPLTTALHYALTLPGMGRPPVDNSAAGTLPQHPEIDLDFDLTGCEAEWKPADGGPTWTGWLPHYDLDVCREFTAGSAIHDALWESMKKPGELTLRCQLDLTNMLRPVVQSDSKIDYEYPPEEVTVAFATSSPRSKLELIAPSFVTVGAHGGDTTSFAAPTNGEKLVPVELRLTTSGGDAALTAGWNTNEDERPRPFPLRRLLLPWAESKPADANTVVAALPPELEGGNWARGYQVFFSNEAGCGKCHTAQGRGGTIGPDLSNLIHRDYASVLRDITHPSFAINPDYLTYNAVLTDGRTLTGVVHTVQHRISISDATGATTEVERSEVEELQPAPISTMPEGLPKQLGADRMRDLLMFLLTAAPQMPRDHAGPQPKPRTVAEVNAVLAGAPDPAEKTRPIRIVLVAGPKDHGPGEHDYPAWQKAWSELLAADKDVEVVTAWEWPEPREFAKTDVIVFYQHGTWSPIRAAAIDAFLERGGGLVYIHWAVDGQALGQDFAKRIGLASGGLLAFRHGELPLVFNKDTKHPIIRNFDKLNLHDESYWKLQGSVPPERVLATSMEDNEPQPQLWSLEKGKGRVFVSIPGHFSWTFDDPLFRVLLLRGIAWTAREPVDRFNDLVWPGADVAK